jgi:DNA-binding transcriptional LysR family regulator
MHTIVLRYLDQATRAGSIRRAAEQLNVPSSAVNRQILRLETEIGVPIFERRGNGVRLTPAGEVLLRQTRQTLVELRRARLETAAASWFMCRYPSPALRQARLACLCIGSAPGPTTSAWSPTSCGVNSICSRTT